MKQLICLVLFTLFVQVLSSQVFFTRSGQITFLSEAPLETIEAHNSKVTSVLDTKTGNIEFAVLIKAFSFEKALMEEHFNENYMESSKYPKAVFKGRIDNIDHMDFAKQNTYEASISGTMNIHNVTREITVQGTFTSAESINGSARFEIALADYDIQIPKVVADNISKTVDINVDLTYELLEK